jgi:hypothetical protein
MKSQCRAPPIARRNRPKAGADRSTLVDDSRHTSHVVGILTDPANLPLPLTEPTARRGPVGRLFWGASDVRFPGLPPATGQHFSFRGASVFELADGKIRRYTQYWDAFGFLVQLGALPAPGTVAPGTPMP